MARESIALAATGLVRASLVLGLLAFVTGAIGFLLAAIAVHTGSTDIVAVPIYPVVHRLPGPTVDEIQLSPAATKRSSKLSLDL